MLSDYGVLVIDIFPGEHFERYVTRGSYSFCKDYLERLKGFLDVVVSGDSFQYKFSYIIIERYRTSIPYEEEPLEVIFK